MAIDEADADHAPPFTFRVLAETFLDVRKVPDDESVLIPPADNQWGRTLVDRALAAEWREFHHKRADIRIAAESVHRGMSQMNRRKAANRQLILQTNSEGDPA